MDLERFDSFWARANKTFHMLHMLCMPYMLYKLHMLHVLHMKHFFWIRVKRN